MTTKCFVIIGLNFTVEQFPSKDQCHNYSPLLLRRLHHWAADSAAHRQPVKHSFFCTVALFCILTSFSCWADRVSLFLSEDIHQQNVSQPSLVTPASQCQLSEPQNRMLQLLVEGGGLWVQQHVLQHDTFKWLLHWILNSQTNVRLLFINYSSAFNRIVPSQLNLGLGSFLCL